MAPVLDRNHGVAIVTAMPDSTLIEIFPTPTTNPLVIEHINEEFTSVCPVTGHPDFGEVILRYGPGDQCVELKSLKLYYQSFRNEGIYYEAVTDTICRDLVAAMNPAWIQIITNWRGRGGIRSRITATNGQVPEHLLHPHNT